MTDYYIKIEGYADTVMAIIHILADSKEEAVNKATEIYMRDFGVYKITRDEALEEAETYGLDIIEEE